MSLQIAAQHLSSQGRGNDSTLVHMSPREVSSLNAIAKAHGGQLSTNPHTGLPEAGFLESILPMVAGAALTGMSGGLINPMTAGLITGGLGYAMTGSLEKGLMMGVGAYGGGGLGEALAAQGVQAAAAPELAAAQTKLGALTPDQITAYQTATEPVMAGPVFEAQNAARLAAQKTAEAQTAYGNAGFMDRLGTMGEGVKTLGKEGGFSNLYSNLGGNPMSLLKTVGSAAAPAIGEAMTPKKPEEEKADTDMGQRYAFSPGYVNPTPGASASGQEQTFVNPTYRPIDNAEAKKIYGYADGGATPIDNPAVRPTPTSYTTAEPEIPISTPAPAFSIPNVNSMADLVRAPESQGLVNAYLNRPAPIDVEAQYNDYLQRTLSAKPTAVANSGLGTTAPSTTAGSDVEYIFDAKTQKYVKNPAYKDATKKKKSIIGGLGPMGPGVSGRGIGIAAGGSISDAGYNLGGYSDGGRLLRGPGDGVSDSIPAVIGKKQPARLADGEFVVPARIVSELGNGSTEAGARKLYAMMDRIQKARGKTVGKGKVAKNSRSEKYLPA